MEVIVLREEELNKYKFSVNPGTRIKDLKSNIALSKHVSEEHSKLFYMDQELEDEKTLSDYNISNYSAIILRQYPYYLRIQCINRNVNISYDLDIEPESTVLGLKKMIKDRSNGDIEDITLFCGSEELDDNSRTISDYKLLSGSTIRVKIEDYIGCVKIFVKTLTGRHIQIEAEQTDTIHDLKLKIQDKEGIPPEQQRIGYKGKLISQNDDATVHDCKIKHDATLHLLPRPH